MLEMNKRKGQKEKTKQRNERIVVMMLVLHVVNPWMSGFLNPMAKKICNLHVNIIKIKFMKYNLRKMGYNNRILGEEREGKTTKGRLKDSELNDQLLKNLDQKQLK